ncbi:amino acid adenylation domain-containing protein [Bacillus cereus]|uniref:non-ribosomal peptide synthetase n=1 Tax=Bacillus cereus TaxID=1396 RepID=UPI001E5F3988|nr:amino acid adenylation domain-containing protein [Bacillus cereus]
MISNMEINFGDLEFNIKDIHNEKVSVKEIRDSDIAVIGIACKIADSQNSSEFWHQLIQGRDYIRPFPEGRKKDLHSLYEVGFLDESMTFNEGGYLEEISTFDYNFFNISPAEARLMDPNQRLFLESAWTAIEDAGYGGEKLSGSRTGVYVGFSNDFSDEYKRLVSELAPSSASDSIPGNIHSIIASRIAYLLNLRGPSMLVDTACSSSLVAVHLACRDLRQGECDLAIAGGVKITLAPIKESEGGGLGVGSPDDRTKTFDNSSNGTGGGEGVVSILLKPLKHAVQDNDQIYAVIKGSAVNNDGTSVGITAPNSLAGEDVIVRAWKDAEVDPGTISYIEAHGTGTKLGDPIEIDGIERAFKNYTDRKQFCAVGSVKTNVGHLDNCAGITGLLKAILALKNCKIPANIHFTNPNSEIGFINSPVYVNDVLQDWENAHTPRRCGVSSFGLSGTNCHVVLEEAPLFEGELTEEETTVDFSDIDTVRNAEEIFTFSAKNEVVFLKYLQLFNQYVKEGKNQLLRDLCYTASTGRGHYNYRLAVVCKDLEDLGKKLAQINPKIINWGKQEEYRSGIYIGRHKIVSAHKEKEPGEITLEEFKLINVDAAELNKSSNNAELKTICSLYVKGADIDWERLYQGIDCKKISIPVYPFERIKCWVEAEDGILNSHKESLRLNDTIHPLLDRCLVETEDQDIYTTRFSPEVHWVLKEHLIMGNYIVPGTTYLEMAREVLSKYNLPGAFLELNDVQFIAPLIVKMEEEQEVHTIVKREGNEFRFTVLSKLNDAENPWEQSWIRHAEGKAVYVYTSGQSRIEIDKIREECNFQQFNLEGDSEEKITAFEFGPRWQTLKKIEDGDNKVLAELELGKSYINDLKHYILHPALLDIAVGVVSQSLGNGLFLPFSYKKIKIFGALPERFYSYIRKKAKGKERGEILTVDIMLFDVSGNILVEIENYSVKKINKAELKLTGLPENHLYHTITWKKQENFAPMGYLEKKSEINNTGQGYILLFKNNSHVSNVLHKRLVQEGNNVIVINQGTSFKKMEGNVFTVNNTEEDYVRLFDALANDKVLNIFHLWGSSTSGNHESLSKVEEDHDIIGLFNLAKVITNEKIKAELVVVSDYGYEVTGKEEKLRPKNASLYGLTKVIAQENPRLECRCIDFDENTDHELVIQTVLHHKEQFLIALRSNESYIECIERFDLQEQNRDPITIEEQGVYIVTGGTGGLGFEISKRLASKNKMTLILIGNTAIPPRSEWNQILKVGSDLEVIRKINMVEQLEKMGATVEVYAANVSNKSSMLEVFEEIRVKHGSINAVIHAAGVAGDGFITLKNNENFQEVLAPKIRGTQIISKITEKDKLDFLVLFSSISSFIGGQGQSDYTAANAYLDTFSFMRNREGKRTITINWAAWKETGMAFNYNVDTQTGLFQGLSNLEALDSFENIMNNPSPRVIVGRLNYPQITNINENELPMALSSEIIGSLEKHRRSLKRARAKKNWQNKISIIGRTDDLYSEIEKVVAKVWAEVLGLDEINIHDNFYQLGGDSLIASKIVGKINNDLFEDLDISDVFNYMTVYELAQLIENQKREATVEQEVEYVPIILPAEKRSYYPVSSAQRRFYMMRQMAGESTLNNLCSAMTITGNINPERLKMAINNVIKRHASLRTSFDFMENELIQRIHEDVQYNLEYVDGDGREIEEYVNDFVSPFDLHSAPLLRAKLIRISDDLHIFLCDVDHIAADGASIGLLMNEIIQGYFGERLPEVGAQYVDFTLWQNQWFASEEMEKQETYWLNVFDGELPVLDLPTDYPRLAHMSNEGNVFTFEMDEVLSSLAKEAATKNGVTLFMLLFAVFNTMLAKYGDQEDIIVGLPSAGRNLDEVKNTIGLFINTLALRTAPEKDKTFSKYLEEVKQHLLEAYKNEDYPFEMLLNKINIPVDRSRNPLFDVQFISQNFSDEILATEELKFVPFEVKMEAVQVDLTVIWYEKEGKLRFHFEYATQLFNRDTIQRLAGFYENILREVINDPTRVIGRIPMNSIDDQMKLLNKWNNTIIDYPHTKLVHQLFEEQAASTPNRIAVNCNNESITYKELNEKANQLARKLTQYNIKAEKVVGIMVERSIEMIISMLAVLKVGAAYLPIDPDFPSNRIDYMIKDSSMTLLLTTTTDQGAQLFSGPIIDPSDQTLYEGESSNLVQLAAPHNLAYIIYTSGSTGKPKGVMIEHSNVVNYITAFQREFKLNMEDVILQQASFTFDTSVEEIFPILIVGGKLVIVSFEELVDVTLLERVIHENRVTLISTSPFILNELNSRPKIPSIHTYISGGDVLKEEYVTNLMKHSKVYNTYGPTEATVCATYYCLSENNVHPIPIGTPIANTNVYVLNDNLELVPVGVPGEIYISGEGVARGYLNQTKLTDEKFLQNPWKPGRKMFKTGDLAKYLPNGNIQFLGRSDQQVKIRGHRIEVGEIEAQMLQHPSIQDVIVVEHEFQPNMKELYAYFVADNVLTVLEIKKHLNLTLPVYMVPSQFVQLEEIPRTINGKVDRKSLPKNIDNVSLGVQYVEPSNEIELRMARLWSQVLPKGKIGILDDFFLMGGQSLLATKLVYLINREWDVNITLRDFFQVKTIQGVAKHVEKVLSRSTTSSFYEQGGLVKPFDLRQSPLFRASLVQLPEDRNMLFLDMHHIITDGLSQRIIFNEFASLYSNKKLPELPVQYKDYSVWQRSFIENEEYKQQKKFWMSQFQGEIPQLQLPLDKPRPDMRRGIGKVVQFDINKEWTSRLKRFAAENDITLFMAFLATYNILLAKLCNQDDIIIGTPVSGRSHASLSSVVGMFVNTIALRNKPLNELTVKEFIAQVKEKTLLALDNQEFPFEKLVEGLELSGKTNRNPLFDTMFTLNNETTKTTVEIPDCKIEYYNETVYNGAQFDLTFNATITHEGIKVVLYYDIDLFNEKTVELIGQEFLDVFYNVILYPTISIGEIKAGEIGEDMDVPELQIGNMISINQEESLENIELLTVSTVENQNLLVHGLNQIVENKQQDHIEFIHQQFEKQVALTPNRVALIYGDTELTYKELNRRANLVAHTLLASNSKPEDIIGIITERSPEMMIAVLAAFKAGVAYVPINPKDPEERIKDIFQDTKVNTILTHQQCRPKWLENHIKNIIDVDILCEDSAELENPKTTLQSSNLAYVIYTSGSTGKPKGVMVEHKALSKRIVWLSEHLGFNHTDTVLQKGAYNFDGSMIEFFSWIIGGGRIVLLENGAESDVRKILETIDKYRVTVAFFIPTLLQVFVSSLSSDDTEKLSTIRWIMSGGEQLPKELAKLVFEKIPSTELLNLYGPTEASIFATYHDCSISSYNQIPIGKPVSDTRAYILNDNQELLPPYTIGELYLGGTSLARGYLNKPRLTEEKFIKNPYIEGEHLYRTGDLAYMLPNGEIVYLGRIDQQVKIRGHRIEMGEIESVLLQHPAVKQAAVIDKVAAGSKYISAYLILSIPCTTKELRLFLKGKLPEYMIPSTFIKVEEIPITSTGKLDRKVLNILGLELPSNIEIVPPRNEIESKLANIWMELLQISSFGIDDHFFELGGDSLLVNQLIFKVNQAFGAEFRLMDVFNAPTIRLLGERIDALKDINIKASTTLSSNPEKDEQIIIPVNTTNKYYPASSSQIRLFIMNELSPGDLSYNLPGVIIIEGKLDLSRLENALQNLIERHESFRTSFDVIDGEIVQIINETTNFTIKQFKTDESDIKRIVSGEAHLFDTVGSTSNYSLSTVKVEKKKRRRREI